jgi:hypothetical protein
MVSAPSAAIAGSHRGVVRSRLIEESPVAVYSSSSAPPNVLIPVLVTSGPVAGPAGRRPMS